MRDALFSTAGRKYMTSGSVRTSLPFIAFLALILLCAWIGGTSRGDAIYLLALRPASILLLAVFILSMSVTKLRPLKAPLLLLAAFAMTMILQLVLSAFTSTGDPTALAQPQLFGGGGSITPDRTWNSLIALITPLAALVGFAALGETRDRVIPILLLLILASAMFGVLNLIAGEGVSFSMYEQFNRNTPSGFFANRNHQAALLAVALPLLRVWSLTPPGERRRGFARTLIALPIALFLGLVILISGSRAGVLLLIASIVATIAIQPRRIETGLSRGMNLALMAGALVAVICLVALTVALGRAPSLDRLLDFQSREVELRVANLPAMLTLLRDALPFGTGFGSFDPAFRVVEPNALLRPTYFNNAHNDLAELAITGGLPVLAVLVAFLGWWLWRSVQVFRADGDMATYRARAGSVGILLLLLASLIDYPLRTPLMGVVFCLCCALLAMGRVTPAPVATGGRGD